MPLRFLLVFILLVYSHFATAQVCLVSHDHHKAKMASRGNGLNPLVFKSLFPKSIGLAFHILHVGGEENISVDAIQTQVEVLNNAFLGTEISFYLALITRTEDDEWNQLSEEGIPSSDIREALLVDPVHLINIFIGDMQNEALGWSVFTDSADPQNHAIVLDFVTIPGNPSDSDYDEGITLVHEMGHYFSLRHPYERGCLEDPTKGDFVADTPPAQNSWFRQCPLAADSCPTLPGQDPVNNYMYATTDACRTSWTAGQVARMVEKIAQFRPFIGGVEIELPADISIASNSEWYFYEGTYQLPEETLFSVQGKLYAQDVVFSAQESSWKGISLNEGSEAYLKNVTISHVSDRSNKAALSANNAYAVLDSVLIDVLPESSSEALSSIGPQSDILIFESHIIQNASAASIKASDSGSIYFGSDTLSNSIGLNRIAGGKLYSTTKGVIYAGSSFQEYSHNHFCDVRSSVLEATEGGIIYAASNFWYNNMSPTLSGSNIFFNDQLGASDCTELPTVNVSTEKIASIPPARYNLSNKPNPFSFETTISFELPSTGHVHLIVYDLLGRPITTLINGFKRAGQHSVTLKSANLPSGTYIYSLATPQGIDSRMLLVLK